MCAYNWFLCVHMEISRKIHVKFLIVMASRDSDQISFNRKLIFLTCISITVAVSWNKIDVRLKEMESPKSLFSQHLLKKKKKKSLLYLPSANEYAQAYQQGCASGKFWGGHSIQMSCAKLVLQALKVPRLCSWKRTPEQECYPTGKSHMDCPRGGILTCGALDSMRLMVV